MAKITARVYYLCVHLSEPAEHRANLMRVAQSHAKRLHNMHTLRTRAAHRPSQLHHQQQQQQAGGSTLPNELKGLIVVIKVCM